MKRKKSPLGLHNLPYQTFYPELIDATGNFKTGIMLSYLCNMYDYFKSKNQLKADGSFWHTRETICKALRLTTAEYRGAARSLREDGYVVTDRRGKDGVNHWILDRDKIHAICLGGLEKTQGDVSEETNPLIEKEKEKALKAQQAAPCPLLAGKVSAEKKKKPPKDNLSTPNKGPILKPKSSAEVLEKFKTSGEDATEEATLDDLTTEYMDKAPSIDSALLFFRRAVKICHNRQPPASELGKNRGMMKNIMTQGGWDHTYRNLAAIVRGWTDFAEMCTQAGYTKKPAWPSLAVMSDMAGNIPTFVQEQEEKAGALESTESKWTVPEI